jgi:hypothetical protein
MLNAHWLPGFESRIRLKNMADYSAKDSARACPPGYGLPIYFAGHQELPVELIKRLIDE